MNEHGFIRAVHDKLPAEVYAWKIHDSFNAGVADAFYCANSGRILFIEYKYIRLPSRDTTAIVPTKLLTPLQQTWLQERHYQNISVATIIGFNDTKNVGIVLPGTEFRTPLTCGEVRTRALSIRQIAAWIAQQLAVTETA